METIIICLLVLAVALLLYVIRQGKKNDNNVQQEVDPLAGLPDIIGRPKGIPAYSSPSKAIQDKNESVVNATDNLKKRNEGASRVSEIAQEASEEINGEPDWREEEEEMRKHAALGIDDGFATGITFDELGIVQEMLARTVLAPSEEKTALALASKIDGTELMGLLESKIGDVSARIMQLLDQRQIIGFPSTSTDDESKFNIGDYV